MTLVVSFRDVCALYPIQQTHESFICFRVSLFFNTSIITGGKQMIREKYPNYYASLYLKESF